MDGDVCCLRLRGLPFTVSGQSIHEFFNSAGFRLLDCLITRSEGKPNGQAFVLLPKTEALKAQVELNNKYLGKRFIEIFSSNLADMEAARRLCAEQPKATGSSNGSQRSKQQITSNLHIIRLRGLPFSATPVEIKGFLAPVELPDGINSIQMVRHPDLRPTGEAYVHLSTETEVMQALNKHKQMMGKRYIEIFPSCLAELQQSLTPPRPMAYQRMDQGYLQGNKAMSADLMHVPMLGAQPVPTGSPAAQAEWLQRQQQFMQLQQQMQLQAAAQQKMLASLQQRQQSQGVNLRMHAQLQAHAQALPNMLQQLQLNGVGSGTQQDTLAPVQAGACVPGLQSPQQQQVLMLNGLNAPVGSMAPVPAMQSGTLASPVACGAVSTSAGVSLSSNLGSSMSGYQGSYGLMGALTAGGLTHSAAAAATATCSPSPLDMQYVPFFCSSASAPMTALMLQEAQGLQPGSLHMFNPSGAIVQNPIGHCQTNGSMQQQSMFAEVLSSSANVVDSTVMGPGRLSAAGGITGPAAFCSDPVLQGMGSGPLTGLAPSGFLRAQGLGRAPSSAQEWLS